MAGTVLLALAEKLARKKAKKAAKLAANVTSAKKKIVKTSSVEEIDEAAIDELIRHLRRAEATAIPRAWAAQWTRMGIGPEHFARMAGELRGRSGR